MAPFARRLALLAAIAGVVATVHVARRAAGAVRTVPAGVWRADRDDDGAADGRLAGRVVDGVSGRPIAGARILVVRPFVGDGWDPEPEPTEAELVAEIRSDDDGRFAVGVVPAHPHRVTVEQRGYAPWRLAGVRAGRALAVALERPAALRGTVTIDGRPGRDVEVRGLVRGLGEVFATRSDARGTWAVDGLPPGPLRIELATRGAESPPWAELQLHAGDLLRHDVALHAGAVTVGTVTDAATGAPLAGAEVSDDARFRRAALADALGHYRLQGFPAPGAGVLHVRAPGHATATRYVGELAARDGPQRVDFALRRGGVASGRVVDAVGVGVPDAWVAAVGARRDAPGVRGAHRVATRTRPDGSFELDGLQGELGYELLVRKPGFGVRVVPFPQPAEADTVLRLPDVALRAGGEIRGVVHDECGAPLSGVGVSLHGADRERDALARRGVGMAGSPYVDTRQAITDERGVFRFADVAVGRYRVAAAADGAEAVSALVEPTSDGELCEAELEVFVGLAIRGRLMAADGTPVELAAGDVSRSDGRPLRGPATVVARRGRFDVRGLEPGLHRIDWTTWRPAGPGVSIEVEAGARDVVVALPRTVELAGLLLAADGAPQPGAWVCARLPDGERLSAPTGVDGRFELAVPAELPIDLDVVVPTAVGGGEPDLVAAQLADPAAVRGLRGPRRALVLRLRE
ncbi:MAG: carboxypeptidase regulatory-like domain-containing protein [Planctomycetes bacterium]|nr:carboxypeptidase regulatory-like domain-containing protein [Planctomycetota bacterium]